MIKPTKSSLRERLLAIRDAIPPPARSIANRKIAEYTLNRFDDWLSGAPKSAVFTYLARPDEVDTRPIIESCAAQNYAVLVPHITSKTAMQAVEFPGWDQLSEGTLGLLSPRTAIPNKQPVSVALIPGLGFTADGGRIGFGRGYYDRWLSDRPSVLRVGLAFAAQLVDWLPMEPHDVALDYLITENGVLACNPGRLTDQTYN